MTDKEKLRLNLTNCITKREVNLMRYSELDQRAKRRVLSEHSELCVEQNPLWWRMFTDNIAGVPVTYDDVEFELDSVRQNYLHYMNLKIIPGKSHWNKLCKILPQDLMSDKLEFEDYHFNCVRNRSTTLKFTHNTLSDEKEKAIVMFDKLMSDKITEMGNYRDMLLSTNFLEIHINNDSSMWFLPDGTRWDVRWEVKEDKQ